MGALNDITPGALHRVAVRRIACATIRHAGACVGGGRACQRCQYLAVGKLEGGKTGRKREAETTACAFTVKLRGVIDGSRLQLVRHALQRRDTVRHALHREVDFHVDVDSQGGELFATLEIGRLMRAEGASIALARGLLAPAPVSSC